ncbi:MAG TPA: protein phosphatase 2C domain-containing protein, partial [Chlamydiales bacterium]|nr:protein phosphatase 2C domain-containing protein [Chlamydiales bacterium]
MFDHVKLSSHVETAQSQKRLHNEDAYLLLENHRFFAVADGMGGHNGGEIASKSALLYLQEQISSSPNTRLRLDALTHRLIDQIQGANTHLIEISQEKALLEGMGTTLAAILFDGRFAIHAHVGDSRLYRYRAGKLDKLTSDHTVYREKLTQQCAVLTQQHVLTRALGGQATVTPSIGCQVAFPKDRYLLCTDGLSDVLSDDELKKHLAIPSLQEACQSLISAAKTAGSQDDITALLIQVEFPTIPSV